MDCVHLALDAIGFVPAIGDVVDLINAGIYLVEGDKLNAGIRALAAIPLIGDVLGKGGKIGSKSVAKGLKATDEIAETLKYEYHPHLSRSCSIYI